MKKISYTTEVLNPIKINESTPVSHMYDKIFKFEKRRGDLLDMDRTTVAMVNIYAIANWWIINKVRKVCERG